VNGGRKTKDGGGTSFEAFIFRSGSRRGGGENRHRSLKGKGQLWAKRFRATGQHQYGTTARKPIRIKGQRGGLGSVREEDIEN